ncbi:MAG TPA: histidine phosphatase family protein, partial [Verrucomicrobiae bacterium]|nr:histidine phosphatase family protein [Verrucomicrobiae bacterium]
MTTNPGRCIRLRRRVQRRPKTASASRGAKLREEGALRPRMPASMERTIRLLLVRHGHVEGIDPERFRGRTDIELTAQGVAQAEAA